MLAEQVIGTGAHHAAAGSSEIFGREFREANKFVALVMAGILRQKKRDVWVVFASARNFREGAAKFLRVIEAHDSSQRIELRAETFVRQFVDKRSESRGGWRIETWEKFAPENGEKTVGAKARGQQQPKAWPGRERSPQCLHSRHPGARERHGAPRFRTHDGISGINDVDRLVFKGSRVRKQSRKADQVFPALQQERQVLFRKVAGELSRADTVEVPGEKLKHFGLLRGA